MSVSPPGISALTTLQQHFKVFDTASQGGAGDGQISRADLETVAANESGQYTFEQVAAAQHLLLHSNDFWQADVAAQDDLHADGTISDEDVDAALVDGSAGVAPDQVFADPYHGSMQTLALDFDEFDGAGDGGARDGMISFNDLTSVAYDNSGRYTPQQQAAARYMLDHLELFNSLDTAHEGHSPDGLVGKDDLSAASTWPPPAAQAPVDPDLNGNGVLDTQQERDLAASSNAPILYADPNDGYLLTDPEDYIAGSTVTTLDGTPVDDPVAYLQENPDAELVMNAGDVSNPTPDATKTYYQYDPATNSITYFYFYPNNDGPQGGSQVGDLQNHEGDWERVTVQLDANFQPTTVYYSSHSGSSSMPWSQVVKENGRPVVFVAAGSHANFFVPGTYHSEFATADDRTVADPASGLRIDTQGYAMTDITQTWWYQDGDRLHWGEQVEHSVPVPEIGTVDFPFFGIENMPMIGIGEYSNEDLNNSLSGPRGPSPDKNTLAPTPPPVDQPYGPR